MRARPLMGGCCVFVYLKVVVLPYFQALYFQQLLLQTTDSRLHQEGRTALAALVALLVRAMTHKEF